jgi:transposase-like protein
VRTTNALERLIEEGRRRTKVLGALPNEKAGPSLVHAVLVDVSKRWRGIRIIPQELAILNELRGGFVH